MPTVAEVLKQSGWTDEEIKAIDGAKMTGLTQVVSTAQQALDAAEFAKRAQAQQYETEIAPALDRWANDKAGYDAKLAAYEAALNSAKEGGFNIPEILTKPITSDVRRDGDGKFVANANAVPGSPGFEKKLTDEMANAFSFAADTQWKYRTLFGQEMPDSPTTIIREAAAQRMPPAEYAAKKYDFQKKEGEIKAAEQKKHDDAIRKETSDAKDKEWAEKTSPNSPVRQASASQFSTVAAAVKKGDRKDTMTMTPEQRRQYTRDQIHKEVAENETVQ